jgi:hypothetical protein
MKDVAVCWSNHPNASEFIASEEDADYRKITNQVL